MKPLTVIMSFAALAFTGLALFLVKSFVGPLAIAAVVLLLILILGRR